MIRPFVDAMSVQPTGGHALFQEPAPSQSAKAQAKPSKKPQSSSQQSASSGYSKTPNKTPFIFKQVCSSLMFNCSKTCVKGPLKNRQFENKGPDEKW